ncbi:hypothetical protein [Nocardia sp. NBC_01009]|uniref:hypothetical protein n=1 Tax=Nocardia sp. NBC_01009 TaxID=2975996 RepID=UPI00386930CF|nr:hypothetical protein OHA42_31125 [Nocardia sp. NBC_01009]
MIEAVVAMVAANSATAMVEAIRRSRSTGESADVTLPSGDRIVLTPQEIRQLTDELGASAAPTADTALSNVAGGLALTDTDEFFRQARRRIDLVFKIRLAIALLIATVLIGTIVGAIVGLALGNTALASGLGATALVDLIGAGVYKPLEKIRQALMDAQRLDMIHLSAKQQLSTITDDGANTIEKYQEVWANILEQIKVLDDK